MSVLDDNAAFEVWLHKQCDVYEPDLRHKHKRMKRDAFTFLRATFFRWAKGIKDICPEVARTPAVLSVGDIHLENFGTWRDDEGRLVWGVNDFDEAAVIPYAFDLIRLAASARLARDAKDAEDGDLSPFLKLGNRDTAERLLAGYRDGLEAPRPVLLDETEMWLRPYVACSDEQRTKFWCRLDELETEAAGDKMMAGFRKRLPQGARIIRTARRPKQGGGSLGRPRFVAIADWQGGRIVREAKALVPSAWDWAQHNEKTTLHFEALSKGRHRSPDPWLHVIGHDIFRRFAPHARKVDLTQHADTDAPKSGEANSRKLLHAMGADLGAIHAASDQVKAIIHDLDRRGRSWLHTAAKAAAHWVEEDYKEWCKHFRAS